LELNCQRTVPGYRGSSARLDKPGEAQTKRAAIVAASTTPARIERAPDLPVRRANKDGGHCLPLCLVKIKPFGYNLTIYQVM
jgi:hypothetical protein